MRYTSDETVSEIMRRSRKIAAAKNRNACRGLAVSAMVLFVALAATIVSVSGDTAAESSGSVYGSFLLSAKAGGCVLLAIAAFASGVAVTILYLRIKSMRSYKVNKEENL